MVMQSVACHNAQQLVSKGGAILYAHDKQANDDIYSAYGVILCSFKEVQYWSSFKDVMSWSLEIQTVCNIYPLFLAVRPADHLIDTGTRWYSR
jgi:hypothetical protein